MFDQYGTQRLTAWKEFRDSLETSSTPLEDVAMLWSHAPFVSPYLNPETPSEWPDPWHLVLDLHLDDLAITLGMLYTIKLTQRFIGSKCEIYTTQLPQHKDPIYCLIIDNKSVLNLEYRSVVGIESLQDVETRLIWTKIDPL